MGNLKDAADAHDFSTHEIQFYEFVNYEVNHQVDRV